MWQVIGDNNTSYTRPYNGLGSERKVNPEKNESSWNLSLSVYVAASTLPARNMASATVDEDMNFMTNMRRIRGLALEENLGSRWFGRLNGSRE